MTDRLINPVAAWLTVPVRRWLYVAWVTAICAFALIHALNLGADFPSNPPLNYDGSMYTDEGWWANAAINAHLRGHWQPLLDYNPAPAVPAWPFLEWVVFCFTGVTIGAARGLAVSLYFLSLILCYLLLRRRGAVWVPLLALSFLVTNPVLYSFSRMALLEPLLITLTLAALNLAVRLPQFKRPIPVSIAIGIIFAFMMLTKTSAAFLAPAVGWAMIQPLWRNRKQALLCALTAGGVSALFYGVWLVIIVSTGHLPDLRYFLNINTFDRPDKFYWPLGILHGEYLTALIVDRLLTPLSVLIVFACVLSRFFGWCRGLLRDPVFGASILVLAGHSLYMIYHCYIIPRYFTVIAFFTFLIAAQGVAALLGQPDRIKEMASQSDSSAISSIFLRLPWQRLCGWAALAVCVVAICANGNQTIDYARHPKFTFVNAARNLTQYIDEHPNGKRLLVSISGDQIALVTNLPSLCDPTSLPCNAAPDPASELARYQPGWYAEWDGIDANTFEAIHAHYSLEYVAGFSAFEDPHRQFLMLFKLHPLPAGQVRDPKKSNLGIPLPDDKMRSPNS